MAFLAIDCGTSTCRASLVSREGEIISSRRRAFSILTPAPGRAEADPDLLWRILGALIRELKEGSAAASIEAVGVSAMLGYVFLDRERTPLLPALIWMDNRARAECEELRAHLPVEVFHRTSGRRLSPELLFPKLLWLRRRRPGLFPRLHRIIGLKDEMVRHLTGVETMDLAHADYTGLFDIRSRTFDPGLCELAKAPPGLFPEPAPAAKLAGCVSREAAAATGLAAGTPVVLGSSDGTTAMYGGGALEQGRAALVSGTSDVLMTRTSSPVEDPQGMLIVNNGMDGSSFLCGGTMGLSGGALRFLEEVTGRKAGDQEEEIAGLPPGAEGLLCIPGLSGERSPYWKEAASGALLGLRPGHGPGHIFRALMEGTAYRLRRLLGMLAESGVEVEAIIASGGCAGLDAWNQIRADVTGLPLGRLRPLEATTLGTALFCRAALEPGLALGKAASLWLREDRRYIPRPEAAERYRLLGELFEQFLEAGGDITARLREVVNAREDG